MRVTGEDRRILPLLDAWWVENRRDFPWREPHLSPYQILIAEIMLQKTRAIKVARVWRPFLELYPDPFKLAEASVDEVGKAIFHLGLQKRAGELKNLAKKIVADHGGEIPKDKDTLLSLPGVGEYTANAVRDFAMGEVDPIVDSNTRRIVARVWGIDDEDVAPKLKDLIREDARGRYYMLFDFGAIVCKAPYPDCLKCPISSFCDYFLEKSAVITDFTKSMDCGGLHRART